MNRSKTKENENSLNLKQKKGVRFVQFFSMSLLICFFHSLHSHMCPRLSIGNNGITLFKVSSESRVFEMKPGKKPSATGFYPGRTSIHYGIHQIICNCFTSHLLFIAHRHHHHNQHHRRRQRRRYHLFVCLCVIV